ncbi:MAG TPA: hypothetical protein VMI92_06955 [Steroidobacteraceae bacterium]|nr:hypothetical protein [Steroidobacteraceae bacterium]
MNKYHRVLVPVAGATLMAVAALWPPGVAAATAASADQGYADANALMLNAEVALQRDHCREASIGYSTLARQLSDVGVAARATQVALDCGQPELAQQGVARWRQLAPQDADALLAGVSAQLALYRIPAARAQWLQWLDSSAAKDDAAVNAAIASLVQQSSESAVAALLASTTHAKLRTASLERTQALLAFETYDDNAAIAHAKRALAAGSDGNELPILIARAQAGVGQADAALASAASLKQTSADDAALLRAEILQLLGRDKEAADAFDQLMDSKVAGVQRDARRLRALLAVEEGDLTKAESLLTPMLRDPQGAAAAVYELSTLAEQRGDNDAALRGYQLLTGTELEAAARQRSARLLCRQGARDAALNQLQVTASGGGVRERLEQKLGRAELLADCGAAEEGLRELATPLKEMSGNSELQYQRAVLLERAGRTKESLAQFRILQAGRPQDPEIANALGFTLADHRQDLPHAEQLIRQALMAQPDNPSMLDSLAWVRYQRGAPREALPLLERAWNLLHNGDIGAHWGEVLWSLGQKSEALAIWQKAYRQDPDSDLLQKLLAQHPLQVDSET